MNRRATEPIAVARYFGSGTTWIPFSDAPGDGIVVHRDHAIVRSVFRPGSGWFRYPCRKRVSGNWVRQARAEGITAVALQVGPRVADFRIEELTRR
jgi:hypothetical protein